MGTNQSKILSIPVERIDWKLIVCEWVFFCGFELNAEKRKLQLLWKI